jgi:hypothetical protein
MFDCIAARIMRDIVACIGTNTLIRLVKVVQNSSPVLPPSKYNWLSRRDGGEVPEAGLANFLVEFRRFAGGINL